MVRTHPPRDIPRRPLEHEAKSEVKVFIKNPDQSSRLLLRLPKLEASENPPVCGIHHGILKLACEVLTNNSPGFLSEVEVNLKNVGEKRMAVRYAEKRAFDLLLLEDVYWYYALSEEDENFEVLGSFKEWGFPMVIPKEFGELHQVSRILPEERIQLIISRDSNGTRESSFRN